MGVSRTTWTSNIADRVMESPHTAPSTDEPIIVSGEKEANCRGQRDCNLVRSFLYPGTKPVAPATPDTAGGGTIPLAWTRRTAFGETPTPDILEGPRPEVTRSSLCAHQIKRKTMQMTGANLTITAKDPRAWILRTNTR